MNPPTSDSTTATQPSSAPPLPVVCSTPVRRPVTNPAPNPLKRPAPSSNDQTSTNTQPPISTPVFSYPASYPSSSPPPPSSHPPHDDGPAPKRPALSTPGWDLPSGAPSSSSFSMYMSTKVNKLRTQFESERRLSVSNRSNPHVKMFLQGVIVWVDGLTSPSRNVIRSTLIKHGGMFETYFSSRVTHVIADRLANATKRRLAPMTKPPRGLKCVTAAWVSECVRVNAKVPERAFATLAMGAGIGTSAGTVTTTTSGGQRNVMQMLRGGPRTKGVVTRRM